MEIARYPHSPVSIFLMDRLELTLECLDTSTYHTETVTKRSLKQQTDTKTFVVGRQSQT
ncbi:hypothetical protein [Chitinophaga pinensis]|uniref:hypothetical protein n=1 Tax=Chitinophaga pinensis TaxID=79329 RepID=UPI001648C2E0|nr:hypothetical protein [Chitinophaga pinensis]